MFDFQWIFSCSISKWKYLQIFLWFWESRKKTKTSSFQNPSLKLDIQPNLDFLFEKQNFHSENLMNFHSSRIHVEIQEVLENLRQRFESESRALIFQIDLKFVWECLFEGDFIPDLEGFPEIREFYEFFQNVNFRDFQEKVKFREP